MIFSDLKSRPSYSVGAAARIRCSITGTTIIVVARFDSRLSSTSTGSNRRATTSVEPSATPSSIWLKPSAWKIGAHSCVTPRARNGTFDNTPPTGANDIGTSRSAPFGVPVVPLVRITNRGACFGFGGAFGWVEVISAISVSSALWRVVSQPRRRPRRGV